MPGNGFGDVMLATGGRTVLPGVSEDGLPEIKVSARLHGGNGVGRAMLDAMRQHRNGYELTEGGFKGVRLRCEWIVIPETVSNRPGYQVEQSGVRGKPACEVLRVATRRMFVTYAVANVVEHIDRHRDPCVPAARVLTY